MFLYKKTSCTTRFLSDFMTTKKLELFGTKKIPNGGFLDIVGILNEENDYTKVRNYWKYLKTKLKKEHPQLVSDTNQFKLVAPDKKSRLTDALDSNWVISLAKHFPNNRAMKFLDWFLYSKNTIDGQSKKKLIRYLKAIWSMILK